MLSFAEEIMLLLVKDEAGRFDPVSDNALYLALSGAVLMDLALGNRIDTDPEILTVLDSTPMGNPLVDPVLAQLSEAADEHDVRYWIGHFKLEAGDFRQKALECLCKKNILERRKHRFLWVFKSHRYPVRDVRTSRHVKLRILSTVFSDEIPDPRDIALISLMDACNIFPYLLSGRELMGCRDRIDQIRRLDLIGRTVTKAVRQIELQLAKATLLYGGPM